jgi:hypothetical protein
MRILIVTAHPASWGFTHKIADTYKKTAETHGHEVFVMDLYDPQFAQLYTTDFNLLKVAEVEGVSTLNVNELAQKLRPNVLPGETMKIKIIQKGSGAGQGVGYSDDGTMVVVEKADKQIGKMLDVTVDRMFNTMAGKMIFAKSKQAVVPNPQPTKTTKGYRTTQPKPRTPAQKPAHDGFVTDLRRELQG